MASFLVLKFVRPKTVRPTEFKALSVDAIYQFVFLITEEIK